MTTEIGPVQYLVIGFPGNKFNGEIAPELGKLASSGVVRILDIVFVGKDTDGSVVVFEYDELEELALFAEIDGEVGGLANSDDVKYAAGMLEPGSSGAVIVWEDTWATGLAQAIRASGGEIIEGGRIPHDLVTAALSELPSAS